MVNIFCQIVRFMWFVAIFLCVRIDDVFRPIFVIKSDES